jgi:23S rRNA (uracil1939-C5)-methyltransferase
MTQNKIDCPHATLCAGCPAIHLSYDQQLEAKLARVKAAFARFPDLSAIDVAAVRSAEPNQGYRSRVKWMAAGKASLGLYKRNADHEVVDIPECRVASANVNKVGEAVRALFREGVPGVDGWFAPFGFKGLGAVRAVDIREVDRGKTTGVLLSLVVDRGTKIEKAQAEVVARELAKRVPVLAGVALNAVDPKAPQVLGPIHVLVWGESELWDKAGSVRVRATFGSFVQAHRAQSAWVQSRLVELISDTKRGGRRLRVLDLFGGSGALGLALAKTADVELVESFGPASKQAQAAADADKLSLRAWTDDAARAVARMVSERTRFDLVVVNPPRRGAEPAVREAIAALHPRQIAYVSCEPTTLARDLDHLLRLGYSVVTVEPLDMIPLTDEVETLVVLRANELVPPRVLFVDATVIAVEKGAHEPTAPQGEYGVSLLDRVRLLEGAEDAVPIHRLDVGTSGVCLFARKGLHVKPWAGALAATTAKKEYRAAVKGKIPPRGSINRAIREGAKDLEAHTKYRRLEWAGGHSLVAAFPGEARTHQVRKHLSAIGFPVLGDERYGHGPTNKFFSEKFGLDRTFLHLASIELVHPVTKEAIKIESELPGDLASVLDALRTRPERTDFVSGNLPS